MSSAQLVDAVLAEVRMSQMQYNKVQNLCYDRCIAHFEDDDPGDHSSGGGGSSSPSTAVEPSVPDPPNQTFAAGEKFLSSREKSCVEPCVEKFYGVAMTVAEETQKQAMAKRGRGGLNGLGSRLGGSRGSSFGPNYVGSGREWSFGEKAAVGGLGLGVFAGFLMFLGMDD